MESSKGGAGGSELVDFDLTCLAFEAFRGRNPKDLWRVVYVMYDDNRSTQLIRYYADEAEVAAFMDKALDCGRKVVSVERYKRLD